MSFTIFLLIKMCTKIGQNKICYQINLEEILKNLEEILKTWMKFRKPGRNSENLEEIQKTWKKLS